MPRRLTKKVVARSHEPISGALGRLRADGAPNDRSVALPQHIVISAVGTVSRTFFSTLQGRHLHLHSTYLLIYYLCVSTLHVLLTFSRPRLCKQPSSTEPQPTTKAWTLFCAASKVVALDPGCRRLLFSKRAKLCAFSGDAKCRRATSFSIVSMS